MKTKPKLILFVLSIVLSFLGWMGYGWISYIMGFDLDLAEYDKKYFADFPAWLGSIKKMTVAFWIALIISIILIPLSGYLSNRFRILSLVVLILDIIVLSMSTMLFI